MNGETEREKQRSNISSGNSGKNEPSAGEIAAMLSDVFYNADAENHSPHTKYVCKRMHFR